MMRLPLRLPVSALLQLIAPLRNHPYLQSVRRSRVVVRVVNGRVVSACVGGVRCGVARVVCAVGRAGLAGPNTAVDGTREAAEGKRSKRESDVEMLKLFMLSYGAPQQSDLPFNPVVRRFFVAPSQTEIETFFDRTRTDKLHLHEDVESTPPIFLSSIFPPSFHLLSLLLMVALCAAESCIEPGSLRSSAASWAPEQRAPNAATRDPARR